MTNDHGMDVESGDKVEYHEMTGGSSSSTRYRGGNNTPNFSPKVKRTRNRGVLSCTECRRLKAKCDLEVPCSGCIKRGCEDLCPDQSSANARQLIQDKKRLEGRIKELERALANQSRGSPSKWIPDPEPPQMMGLRFDGSQSSISFDSPSGPTSPFNFQSTSSTSRLPTTHEQPQNCPQTCPNSEAARRHVGNLVLDSEGRSKYLGPSANQQWLCEGTAPSPTQTPKSSSPMLHSPDHGSEHYKLPSSTFPGTSDLQDTFNQLPPKQEVRYLIDKYFELAAWRSNPISLPDCLEIFEDLYSQKHDNDVISRRRAPLNFQRLSLLFALMSVASHVCLEISENDKSGFKWHNLSQQCLWNSRPMSFATDISVQAIALIARFYIEADVPRGAETAWHMRGLAARSIQSMGIHRDGSAWNLGPAETERRRRIFWEAFVADTFMGRNLGRPSGIALDQYDTKLPECPDGGETNLGGFEKYKAGLAEITKETLDSSINVKGISFEAVRPIWQKYNAWEATLPIHLRCRAALKAMVSIYPSFVDAERASLPPDQNNIRLALQQYSNAVDSSGAVLYLLHPFFVQALCGNSSEPTESPYASAYLAVIERSGVLIAIIRDLFCLLPALSTRFWFFWTHGFTAAVCLASVCIISSNSTLASYALAELDSMISLFQNSAPWFTRKAHRSNLETLCSLRETAISKMLNKDKSVSSIPSSRSGSSMGIQDSTVAEHLSVTGWMTRLVRLGKASVAPEAADTLAPPSNNRMEFEDIIGTANSSTFLNSSIQASTSSLNPASSMTAAGLSPASAMIAGSGLWAQEWAAQDLNGLLYHLANSGQIGDQDAAAAAVAAATAAVVPPPQNQTIGASGQPLYWPLPKQ